MYCATKTYNLALSKSLQDQYAHKIDVLSVTPGSVRTALNPNPRPFTVEPEQTAKAVIDHLGWHDQTWGSYWHAYQHWLEVTGPVAPIYGPLATIRHKMIF